MTETLAGAYDGFVVDLDGVVYRGEAAVPNAVEALDGIRPRIQFATNNASRPPAHVAEHLRELGLAVATDQVATSSQAGAAVLRGRIPAGAAVLAVGGAGVSLALEEQGFLPVRTGSGAPGDCAAVLQGYGSEVSAADLARAAYEIQAGALWVATNVDLTLPTEFGLAPGNGSLVGAVAHAVGRTPDTIAGKPYPDLYRLCAERLGAPVERLLAIGDRLDTDIAGAVTAGMDSLLVLTGVSSLAEAVRSAETEAATFLAPDLGVLHSPLGKPVAAEGRWRCGQASGRIDAESWIAGSSGTIAEELTLRLHAVRAHWPDPATRTAPAIRIVEDALNG